MALPASELTLSPTFRDEHPRIAEVADQYLASPELQGHPDHPVNVASVHPAAGVVILTGVRTDLVEIAATHLQMIPTGPEPGSPGFTPDHRIRVGKGPNAEVADAHPLLRTLLSPLVSVEGSTGSHVQENTYTRGAGARRPQPRGVKFHRDEEAVGGVVALAAEDTTDSVQGGLLVKRRRLARPIRFPYTNGDLVLFDGSQHLHRASVDLATPEATRRTVHFGAF